MAPVLKRDLESFVDHVDEVVLLEDGLVTTRGTHADLLRREDDAAARYRDVVGRGMGDDDTPRDPDDPARLQTTGGTR